MKKSLVFMCILGLIGQIVGLVCTFFDERILQGLALFITASLLSIVTLLHDKQIRG